MLCFMAMTAVYVIADLWRHERRQGKIGSALACVLLAASVMFCALTFGNVAVTGKFPDNPKGECR